MYNQKSHSAGLLQVQSLRALTVVTYSATNNNNLAQQARLHKLFVTKTAGQLPSLYRYKQGATGGN